MNLQTTKRTYPLEIFHTKLPHYTKVVTEGIYKKLDKLSPEEVSRHLQGANYPRYLSYEELRYREIPRGFTPDEWWYVVKTFRKFASVNTPIAAQEGTHFSFVRLTYSDEFLHKIDMYAGGQLSPSSSTFSSSNRQTLITRGIIEEAIASSQLEGAHTTRKAAREMILERRQPRNESEQMILNNYRTMLAIEETYKNTELTLSGLFEIHRLLTKETLDLSMQGRLRKNVDDIVVQGTIGSTDYITHVPPDEKFVAREIVRLLEYANDADEKEFTHPVIKAIILHFWVGYLHPFVDGNGRLARALFYWYLLRKGYWTFMYIPISTVIKKAPLQYAMAYIYAEQDGSDFTYFYDFHMRKIMQALTDLQDYIKEKVHDNRELDAMIRSHLPVNYRQKQLLYYLLSETHGQTTIGSHATINNISRQTAAKDLQELVTSGYLSERREGKGFRYFPTDKLRKLISSS